MSQPTVVATGRPATSPHTRNSNGGTPSAVRSMPKTSQTVPNSNGDSGGITSTATVESMRPVVVAGSLLQGVSSATSGRKLLSGDLLP